MNYEHIAKFVQQGGTVYFVLIFIGACVYALWPKNKQGFQEAARIPLEENDDRPA